MGQGRTAKASLCFAIIHLYNRREETRGANRKTFDTVFVPFVEFSAFIFLVETTACLSTSWSASSQKNKMMNVKLRNVMLNLAIPDIFHNKWHSASHKV